MIEFGKKVRTLRKEKKISIIELSKSIGYSKSIINYWENGKKEPTFSAIVSLCKFFDVSADYLLGLSDY